MRKGEARRKWAREQSGEPWEPNSKTTELDSTQKSSINFFWPAVEEVRHTAERLSCSDAAPRSSTATFSLLVPSLPNSAPFPQTFSQSTRAWSPQPQGHPSPVSSHSLKHSNDVQVPRPCFERRLAVRVRQSMGWRGFSRKSGLSHRTTPKSSLSLSPLSRRPPSRHLC